MNKATTILIMALLFANSSARGDAARAARLTQQQKENIAWAIQILIETEALQSGGDKKAKFDSDVIEELMKSGLLKRGDSKLQSICIDPEM